MLLIGGTIPSDVGQVMSDEVMFENGHLKIAKKTLPVNRGTAALVGAAAMTCQYLNLPSPYVVLAGDIGQKSSGAAIYEAIQEFLRETQVRVMALHYLMPNIRYHKRLMAEIQKRTLRPVLIADAGSMYVAKAAKQAPLYDLFTPDLGELAFLADDKADHPAYTRGFICHMEAEIPKLIQRAYAHQNASQYLCVKGQIDYVCRGGEILERIDEPYVEALEAIGGTGDTLTGIATALISKGEDIDKACVQAAKINRWAGKLANPTPATQIADIIRYIPKAIQRVDG